MSIIEAIDCEIARLKPIEDLESFRYANENTSDAIRTLETMKRVYELCDGLREKEPDSRD